VDTVGSGVSFALVVVRRSPGVDWAQEVPEVCLEELLAAHLAEQPTNRLLAVIPHAVGDE